MKLNKSTGNMYDFVSHTGNIIKGTCPHGCSYCYMNKWGEKECPIYFDESELRTKTEIDNFIFVGSNGDMFAEKIPKEYIWAALNHCYESNNNLFEKGNKYFFQSKNPQRFLEFIDHPIFKDSVVCTTIESDIWYPEHMGKCPSIESRVEGMEQLALLGIKTYLTAEPLMKFNLEKMLGYIKRCNPVQVNFGRNTYRKVILSEPTGKEIEELIFETAKITDVVFVKKNLVRKYREDVAIYYNHEKEKYFRKRIK